VDERKIFHLRVFQLSGIVHVSVSTVERYIMDEIPVLPGVGMSTPTALYIAHCIHRKPDLLSGVTLFTIKTY
jgi:hypothetical protein